MCQMDICKQLETEVSLWISFSCSSGNKCYTADGDAFYSEYSPQDPEFMLQYSQTKTKYTAPISSLYVGVLVAVQVTEMIDNNFFIPVLEFFVQFWNI